MHQPSRSERRGHRTKEQFNIIKESVLVHKDYRYALGDQAPRLLSTPRRHLSFKDKRALDRYKAVSFFRSKSNLWFTLKLKRFHELSLSNTDLTKALNHYVTVIYEQQVLSRGLVPTLRKCKTLFGIACRIASSHTFSPLDFAKVDKRGYPKIFGPDLVALLMGSLEERKCALTIFQLYKLVEGSDNKIDLSTIVDKPVLDPLKCDDDIHVGNYLHRALNLIQNSDYDSKRIITAYNTTLMETFPTNQCDNRLSKISELSDIYISSKRGPNGPSIGGIPADFTALIDYNSGSMLTNLVKISRLTNNTKLLSIIREYYSDNPQIRQTVAGKSNIPRTSKLSIKNETGGRNRIFAIGDWFSQSSLKGYHDYIFRWLKNQSEDGTHDQDRVSTVVQNWTVSFPDPANEIYSTDLTAATDRIPIEMQTEIVAQIAGLPFAQLWRNIMVDREFETPTGSNVKYAVGQPMGLLSSWAMLAVWHHIICRTCLKYYGLDRDPNLPDYVVIGDDVCTKGVQLGKLYAFLVRDLCGVKISEAKGFSKETLTSLNPLPHSQQMHVAEIAKRIFVNGKEITSLSPELIKSALENSSDFPNLLNKMETKGGYDLSNLQKTGPNLTDLAFKPKRSILLSSFPLKPAAPYQGLTKLYLEGILPDWAKTLPWYKDLKTLWTLEELELDFVRILRREAINSLFGSLALVAEWNESKDKDSLIVSGGWEFKNLVLLPIMKIIIDSAAKTIHSLNDPESENYPIVDGKLNIQRLEQYLKRILVLFELNLSFEGKNIYVLTSKKREGKLIASCIDALLAQTIEARESVFEKRKQETINTWDRIIKRMFKEDPANAPKEPRPDGLRAKFINTT